MFNCLFYKQMAGSRCMADVEKTENLLAPYLKAWSLYLCFRKNYRSIHHCLWKVIEKKEIQFLLGMLYKSTH